MGTVKFAGLLPLKINSKTYLRSELRRKCVCFFFPFPGLVFKHLEYFPLYTVIKVRIVEWQGELTVWVFNAVKQICHFGNVLNGMTRVTSFQHLERCYFRDSDFIKARAIYALRWLLAIDAVCQETPYFSPGPKVHLSLVLSFALFY